MFIIPYLVLAGVALLFFIVLYGLLFGFSSRKKVSGDTVKIPPMPKRHTRKPQKKAEEKKPLFTDEKTQIISFKSRGPAASAETASEETKVFTRDDLKKAGTEEKKQARTGPFPPEPEPFILKETPDLPSLEEYFVRHFLNRYGAVSKTVEEDTRRVTHHLIESLGLSGRDAVDTLSHIMVQEALQNAQRAYVMMPTDLVLEMTSDAFADVAKGSRSETRTILAYDALKAMPRMEESEFHALALLLLFHYSRNTDNYDAKHLKSYAEKYVAPFLAALPDEYTGYQQLEYLHCISLENRDTAFGQVLHDSYPLIFAFRGCAKAELMALSGSWPESALAESLYNSYYKLAAVDEGSLFALLDRLGLQDENLKKEILALLESRPVAYDRKELAYILGKVSPYLEKVQAAWDTSLLRRASLTLMGMYIAKICIREMIGEDFDLSHWM